MTPAELRQLRLTAEAAKRQIDTGPKEWPGTPSAQRLALFLAATPDVILRLVEIAEGRPAPSVKAGQASLFDLDGEAS